MQLMSLENRRERVHRREVSELRRIIELHEQERKKLEEELDTERERARLRGTELTAGFHQTEKLRLRVGELEQDLGRKEEELHGMGGLFRRRMKKALKDQLALFRKSCHEQSQNAVTKVQGYVQARGQWEKADRLLSQAKGAKQLAEGLRGDGVLISDSIIAGLIEEEAKCTRERAALSVEGLSSDDFEFNLPSNLGIPNLDPLDFGPGVLMGIEDRPEVPSEDSEEDGDDEEEEDLEDPGEETGNEQEMNADSGVVQDSTVELAGAQDVAQESMRGGLRDGE